MKKFSPSWLFLFVALYLPYVASAGVGPAPIDAETCQPGSSAPDAAPIDAETCQPDSSASDIAPIDAETCQPDSSASDIAPIDAETYQPDSYLTLVENYCSLIFESLKMDYLYNLNAKNPSGFPVVKKLDWSTLFRKNWVFLYGIRLNQSRFAVCVGVGFSNLYYAFAGEKRGQDTIYKKLKRVTENDVIFEDLNNNPGRKVYRSTLKISFFDFLVRLRFNSVLEAPKEGFHGWLGFKLGLRSSAKMKYNYKEYDDSGACSATSGTFNLNACAPVLQVGMGYHRFGFVGGIHFRPLFQKNKSPAGSDSLRPFSFGMYIDLL